ncbi:MAG: DnaJ domain-containing protein [Oscillospiraceae bacterium]|nr:DnaJ domain-containing protein [Oscillospiraceae bacterium]
MNDPYSVLGVSSRATDEEVKKAYHDMVRKYHPDNYHDNPLSDLAQEKMKEVNEAYNNIMTIREGSGGYRPGARSGATSGSSVEGARVRAAISSGNLELAEQLLKNFPSRSAEWNFLMGSVCYRKGWLDDALNYFRIAAEMEPNNSEYAEAIARMNNWGSAYRPYGGGPVQQQNCDACDCCAAMMCMNMCCRCG